MNDEMNKTYRKKFQVKLGEVQYDEQTGITVSIKEFYYSTSNENFVIALRIGFLSGEVKHENCFIREGKEYVYVGKFWDFENYRLLLINFNTEEKIVEFEIVQLPKKF